MLSIFANIKGNTTVLAPIIVSLLLGTATLNSDTAAEILAATRDTRRSADVYQVTMALAMYYDDHEAYPVIGENNPDSWQILANSLSPEYIQVLPDDPGLSEGLQYDYVSDGQKAIVQYYSEVDEVEKERWSY